MTAALIEVRDLLHAAEELVIADWRALHTPADEGGTLSRGTAAATALDRVAQLGSLLIDLGHVEGVALVVDSLARLFCDADREGFEERGSQPEFGLVARRRSDIVVRVYLLGALAVARRTFGTIRALVLQRADTRRHDELWLRETVTELARTGQLRNGSLLPVVADYVTDRDPLFRRFRRRKDDLVNALCQFDFLQCVIAVSDTQDIHRCYPNFGGFYNERTEPIVLAIVADRVVRQQVVPGISDRELAGTIRTLDALAARLFFSTAGWHQGDWGAAGIRQFLAENPHSDVRG